MLRSTAFGSKMGKNKTHLSFVCVSRNDNHGGNALERLVYSCKNFVRQSEKFKIPCEYLVVEWNPPQNKPRLIEALKSKIRSSNWTKIKVITVPRSTHNKFDYSENLPLFQMIGKNVGIRRASGEFILSSNIDILLSDRLFIESQPSHLEKGVIYRSNRLDLANEIVKEEFSEKSAFRFATRLNVMPNTIQLGSGSEILSSYRGSVPTVRSQKRKIFKNKIQMGLGRVFSKNLKDKFPLHTNACGDFHLLDRQSWDRLGGYSEINLYSFHIDSLFMYSALSLGIYSIVFPPPLYHFHIDHSSGWIPEQQQALFDRLRKQKIGFLDQEISIFEELYRRGQMELVPYPQTWGLPDSDFEEQTI